MADISDEKAADATVRASHTSSPAPQVAAAETKARGKPWMYKRARLGPLALPAYASPQFQVVFVALVCFLCPGMFNAINGLGAAGGVDPVVADHANTALYATFCVVGFFGGTIANKIGLRLTLGFGGFGYFLYVASFLSYKHDQVGGFNIFAGALLGVCAGLLWTAQGAVMLSYPPEESKGRYIAVFWMIFNLGGVIGALIPLGQNLHEKADAAVSDGTYIAFMVLMAFGFVLSTLLCNPQFVERADGSHVVMMKHPSWRSELLGMWQTIRSDWWLVALFPAFWASNWFYTYHFQDYNFALFNTRTRSLNNVLYWLMQIVGAYVTGFICDIKSVGRPNRARIVFGYLFILTMVIWGGGFDVQKMYTRASVAKGSGYASLDFEDPGYVGKMFLYMFYGFYDATWQTSIYWLMGTFSNNARKLAFYAGFYKSIQSAGAAVSPVLDSQGISYDAIFASNWALLAGSLVVAAPVIWTKVTDTTTLAQDLKFSDETALEVAATGTAVSGSAGHATEKEHVAV